MPPGSHPRDDLFRYVDGDLDRTTSAQIEAHVATCTDCREHLAFLKDLKSGLGQIDATDIISSEPCPSAFLLASYEDGRLDKKTATNLRAHMFFCQACAEDFLLLRRMSRENSWAAILDRLKEAIDIGLSYVTAQFSPAVKIITDQPAVAMRGDAVSVSDRKLLEVTVGTNMYSLEITAADDGGLRCDIAGVNTQTRKPLVVSVWTAPLSHLLTIETSVYGNAAFAVMPTADVPSLYRFKCVLDDQEADFLFKGPAIRRH